jgi:hypothetical protein
MDCFIASAPRNDAETARVDVQTWGCILAARWVEPFETIIFAEIEGYRS